MLHAIVEVHVRRPSAKEPHRRNSDFFGLGTAAPAPSTQSGVGGAVKPVTAVGIRASAPAYSDHASKCAFLVHMSKNDFLAMAPETAIPRGDGQIYYSYRELIRRNFYKDYGELQQSELEKYLTDEEFPKVFQRSKVRDIISTLVDIPNLHDCSCCGGLFL